MPPTQPWMNTPETVRDALVTLKRCRTCVLPVILTLASGNSPEPTPQPAYVPSEYRKDPVDAA